MTTFHSDPYVDMAVHTKIAAVAYRMALQGETFAEAVAEVRENVVENTVSMLREHGREGEAGVQLQALSVLLYAEQSPLVEEATAMANRMRQGFDVSEVI